MLGSLVEVLEIAMILTCIILLFLLVMIKQMEWEEYSLNDQEIMILIHKISYSQNLKILLLLSLLLIPISGLFLTGVHGFDWHFFAIAEVTFIFLYFVHREWQNIIKSSYSKPAIQKKHRLQKCVMSPKNKVFWLYIGLFGLVVLFSINIVYRFKNLFSPTPDVETELIIIVVSFISISIIIGLLSILPTLIDTITRIKTNINTCSPDQDKDGVPDSPENQGASEETDAHGGGG